MDDKSRRFRYVPIAALTVAAAVAHGQPGHKDLSDMSLEELGNIEITSASKRPEPLSDAPASIYVISADDIRRSGATTLPEALRLAPNLQVAQVYANGYAISARGFNSSSANKLLVLIDGRSVYTPLFGGVFWDVQDVVLGDVERIEVISGPGGTLWGVNAVNGVINVITRAAAQTRGTALTAAAGNDGAMASARQGLALGDGSVRLYAKRTQFEHTQTAGGADVDDASQFTQVGFRGDWQVAADKLTVQGDAYRGRHGQPEPGSISISGVALALGDITTSGANLLAHWDRILDDGASVSVQAYYDRTQRTVPPTFAETLDLADLQFQHSFRAFASHDVVWGAELRQGQDRLVNSVYFAFLPARLNQAWSSLFAQDEIALGERLRLTLGARIERNDYTGNEWLPNARLAWKLAPEHLLWTAVSRTVRAPSRLDRDAYVPGQPPFLLRGGPDFSAEVAKVVEFGYRGQPLPNATLSVTVYQADYDHLRTQEAVLSAASPYLYFGNAMAARVRGLEAWGSVQLMPGWKLHAGFTRLLQRFDLAPGSFDLGAPAAAAGANPGEQLSLRSAVDLPWRLQFDAALRCVSRLAAPAVPGYTTIDARLGWHATPDTEISVSGKNLLGARHGEFTSVATRTAFGPSVLLAVDSRF
ncbi:MAG: TonB-dependent receptor [Paucibacter sp.]|nr:TonB-dependent receptor [Roseateles sp.]